MRDIGTESARSEPADLIDLLRQMLLIRRFDETALELVKSGLVYGVVHPYIGQEAVAVGVCSGLRPSDKLLTYHRGHGHSIAKGASLNRMMAELFGRTDGCCKGKGGSMHIADFSVGMLGANGIVAAGMPQAVGAALAEQLQGRDGVVACFFGDGASGQGLFHESLHLAALWSAPVVFVCENNQMASGTPTSEILARQDIAGFAAPYGIPSMTVDGTDVRAVSDEARAAISRARRGQGPTLLECRSFRFGAHARRREGQLDGRTAEEIGEARKHDPIQRLRTYLASHGLLDDETWLGVETWVNAQLAEAIRFAEASPFPRPEEALDDLFAGVGGL